MAMLRSLGLIQTKKILSDHMPFLVKYKHISFLSWNMLCQMAFRPEFGYFNNGFICPEEINNIFLNRLFHQATRLRQTARNIKPSFICLHECPETEETREKLAEALKEGELRHYERHFYNNDFGRHYLITLFDTRRFTLDATLTQAVSSLILNEGLKDRILPLVCIEKITNQKWLVVNVHANFVKDVQQDVKDLFRHATELGINEIIFIGDFNRDLLLESDDYSKHDISKAIDDKGLFDGRLHVCALHNGTICTKYKKETDEKTQGVETRDGAIATFPMDIICMTEMNAPDKTSLHTKPISRFLTNIPQGFFEKLNIAADVPSLIAKAAL